LQYPVTTQQTYSQPVLKQQFPLPFQKNYTSVDGVPAYVNNYNTLGFIVEQLYLYCHNLCIDPNKPTDWIQLIIQMKDCGINYIILLLSD
jgi:hypothetical protein